MIQVIYIPWDHCETGVIEALSCVSESEKLCVATDPLHPCHAIRESMEVLGVGCGVCAGAFVVAWTRNCIWAGWQVEDLDGLLWLLRWLKGVGPSWFSRLFHSMPHEDTPTLQFHPCISPGDIHGLAPVTRAIWHERPIRAPSHTAPHLPSCLKMLKHVGPDGLLLHGHDHQEASHEENDAQLIVHQRMAYIGVTYVEW